MSSPRNREIHQLTDGDAVFVAMETPEAPCHIAGLSILDLPAVAPEDGIETATLVSILLPNQ